MGYILPEIYKSICLDNNIELPKVFIETGTAKGGTPHVIMERTKELDVCFEKYYTIELGTDICKIASSRYKYFEEYNRVKLINGDSGVEVENILQNIDERCCFWLDAHSGKESYARGGIDVPLIQELEHIKNHHIKDHIIAIDDAHLFGRKQYNGQGELVCDYSNVPYEVVKKHILEINSKYDIGIYKPYDMEMVIAFIP